MSDTPTTAPALGKLLTMSEQVLADIAAIKPKMADASQDKFWLTVLVKLETELDAQRREVARLTEDRERIEWLEQYPAEIRLWVKGKTVREAIDHERNRC